MISAIVYALLITVAAASGGIFKPGEWYERLEKPGWTPPNWAFPVVWTVLFLMIGAAGWIVWRLDGFGLATSLWLAQLVFNAAWSYLFFGIKRMDWALADAGALWLSIAAFIAVAWPISITAALLFVPYLVWVTVAFALNRSVWALNPDAVAAARAAS